MSATRWCDCPRGPVMRADCPPSAYTDSCDVCGGCYYVGTMTSPARPELLDYAGPPAQQIADSLAADVAILESRRAATTEGGTTR